MTPTSRSSPLSTWTLWRAGLALVLLLVGVAAGLAIQSTFATHGGTQTVHACVNKFTGQARIILPGLPPNCTAQEMLVEWNSDTGGIAGGVSRAETTFHVLPGTFSDVQVSCPNPNEEVTGGGVRADTVAESIFLNLHPSGPIASGSDTWGVVVENVDLGDTHDATVYVMCVPTS